VRCPGQLQRTFFTGLAADSQVSLCWLGCRFAMQVRRTFAWPGATHLLYWPGS
jgi:hypothetical protein